MVLTEGGIFILHFNVPSYGCLPLLLLFQILNPITEVQSNAVWNAIAYLDHVLDSQNTNHAFHIK